MCTNPPRPRWRGFSFALHLLEVQGFYFAPLQYAKIQAFTARFVPSMQNYTTSTAKQRTGLYMGVSCDCACSTANDTRPTKAAIIPPVSRWTLYRSAQVAYYNKVYKGAPPVMDPCRLCRPAGSASPPVQSQPGTLHTAGQSSSSVAAGGAEPLAALAASLFGLSPDSQ